MKNYSISIPTVEDRETTVCLHDIIGKFLDQHCLADTGTPKKANLASTSIGSEEVYDFDTSPKEFFLAQMGSNLKD
jgi:hypothetical protein